MSLGLELLSDSGSSPWGGRELPVHDWVTKKDDGTHKPREGELVSKSKPTFKTRVKRKLLMHESYHKLWINQYLINTKANNKT